MQRSFQKFTARLDTIGLRDKIAARAITKLVSLRDLYEGPDRAPSITAARRAVYSWLITQGKGVNEIARLFDRSRSSVSKLIVDRKTKGNGA